MSFFKRLYGWLINNFLAYLVVSSLFVVLLPWLVFGLNPIVYGLGAGTRGICAQLAAAALLWFFIDFYCKKRTSLLRVIMLAVVFGLGVIVIHL